MSFRSRPVFVSCCLVLAVVSLTVTVAPAQQAVDEGRWAQDFDGALPRWREGGTPDADPTQSLHGLAVDLTSVSPGDMTGPPQSGLMASPPEYDPADGVIFRYGAGWTLVVTDCVVALTSDPAHDEIAYVVVETASQKTSATNNFIAAGADMSKVVFLTHPSDSIWLRDYGPHFTWQDGAMVIADSHYYPSRPEDNFVPTLIAEEDLQIPSYHMGLYYSGGNFQPGPNRSGFVTSLINQDNPDMSEAQIADLYQEYQGIDTLHIMPRLPSSVDGTGHIDMWMYLVDEDDVIIGEFKPGSNPTAISVTNNAVPYMESLGFTVTRVPAWNVGFTHYTYTNAYRVNDRIFIPTYGEGNPDYLDEDAAALAAWQAAAGPGVEIVPINCYSIIPAAGAIHCIVMQVPRYTDPVPSATLLTPHPDALLVGGTVEDIHWAATDDVAVTSVDLEYSVDGGVSYPFLIASGEPNDGHFAWTVPPTYSPDMALRLTAHDAALNEAVVEGDRSCEISDDAQTVYDFSTGAGVDKWGWGNSTGSWSELSGTRYPSSLDPISGLAAGAYTDLAFSDATGGDGDGNRYISAKPSGGRESTHIFEFTVTEDPWTIRDLEILWEGYGDDCLQMELYVWDHVLGDWGDGTGLVGQNNYLANYAGNLDESLVGHIRH
ncbi:MAG: agmatine deiminase family protein, partial [Planctomycetota bacterium]